MANGFAGREGLWILLAVTKGWGEEGGLSVVIRSTQLLGKADREDRPAMVCYRDGDDSMRSSTSLLTLLRCFWVYVLLTFSL